MITRELTATIALLWTALAAAQAPAAARVERVGDAIVFDGRIDAESAAAFLQLAQDPGVRRVVIDSGGGLVAPALDIADAVHDHRFDVEVPDKCLSSCANYVFPAGRHKVLGRIDAVGWHGNMTHVLWLAQTGQASWNAGAMQGARALARREQAFYARIGVDGFVCWFGKIPPYDIDEFYALSPQDMARFGTRDVRLRQAVSDPPPQPDVTLIRLDPQALPQRPVVALAPAPLPSSGSAPVPPPAAGAAAARD